MKHDGLVAGLPVKEGRDLLRHFMDYKLTLPFLQAYMDTARWRAGLDLAVKGGGLDRDTAKYLRREYSHDWRAKQRPGIARRYRAEGLRYKAVTKGEVKALLDALQAEGWIKPGKGDEYDHTTKGGQLQATRMIKRIPRAKAETVVAALIARAKAINAGDYLWWVERMTAFGSYVGESADLGDIDVIVELLARPFEGDWVKENERRAKVSGKVIVWPADLSYGEREVKLALKNRDRYLSLTDPLHTKKLGLTADQQRVIYERDPTLSRA